MWLRVMTMLLESGFFAGLVYIVVALPLKPVGVGALLAVIGAIFPHFHRSEASKGEDDEGARVEVEVLDKVKILVAGAARPVLCAGGVGIIIVTCILTYMETSEISRINSQEVAVLARVLQSLEEEGLGKRVDEDRLLELKDLLEKNYAEHAEDPVVEKLMAIVDFRLAELSDDATGVEPP